MSMVNINPNEISLLLTLIAIALSEGQDANELNFIGNVYITVGSIMVTIAAQVVAQESNQTPKQEAEPANQDVLRQIENLQAQIDELKLKCKLA